MKNMSDQIHFMKFIYEKQRLKNQFHLTFFKTFENLNHDVTFRTLSYVYIHGLKGRCTHSIKSEMKLKLELVLVFNRSRQ